ncbi:MAG: carboxymuconolactone decarboxylase family protein [Rhodopirellula sp. JB044]|uniref:carboxymuconolactone decarboxylase family protein n=1 Tax=Rhodopirellula sp. JB044 TaxID=3342844 RepID=UPI00370B6652
MTRIAPIARDNADEKSQALLDGVQAKLGMTPNLMSTFAHSSAALDAYLKFSDALSKGDLSGKTREKIALAVGQANDCQYCLSAHSAIGKMVGLSAEEILDARMANASDTKTDAILKLSKQIVETRGKVSDADVAAARTAGVTDAEITEVVANTALNLLTNYFNHVAETEVDFPAAEPLSASETCSAGCAQ